MYKEGNADMESMHSDHRMDVKQQSNGNDFDKKDSEFGTNTSAFRAVEQIWKHAITPYIYTIPPPLTTRSNKNDSTIRHQSSKQPYVRQVHKVIGNERIYQTIKDDDQINSLRFPDVVYNNKKINGYQSISIEDRRFLLQDDTLFESDENIKKDADLDKKILGNGLIDLTSSCKIMDACEKGLISPISKSDQNDIISVDLFTLSGLQEDEYKKEAYYITSVPGLIVIPNCIPNNLQLTLIRESLENYARRPNVGNLDTHWRLPTGAKIHESSENDATLPYEPNANGIWLILCKLKLNCSVISDKINQIRLKCLTDIEIYEEINEIISFIVEQIPEIENLDTNELSNSLLELVNMSIKKNNTSITSSIVEEQLINKCKIIPLRNNTKNEIITVEEDINIKEIKSSSTDDSYIEDGSNSTESYKLKTKYDIPTDCERTINLLKQSKLEKTFFIDDDGVKVDISSQAVKSLSSLSLANAIQKLRWVSIGMHYHWATLSYHYDRIAKMPTLIESLCKVIVSQLSPAIDFKPESWNAETGIVNFYQHRDSLMAHQDRSEDNMNAPLLSLSLGTSCVFVIGSYSRSDKPVSLLLNSGDVVVMTKQSRHSFHGVPRIFKGHYPSWIEQKQQNNDIDLFNNIAIESCKDFIRNGARININVRQVHS